MTRFLLFSAFSAALLASPAIGQDEGDLTGKLLACRDIARDGPRLDCFDRLMTDTFGKSVEVEEQREAQFGLPDTDIDDGNDEIVAVISEVQIDHRFGTTIIALDNGQVWQATSAGTIRRGFRVGRSVTIRSGGFGGFRLYMEGSKGFRGVKRVR